MHTYIIYILFFSSSNVRVADTNADMVDGVNMLATMLKATPIVKAGDELGKDCTYLLHVHITMF